MRQGETSGIQIRRDLAFLSSLFATAKHWDDRITSNPAKDYDKSGLADAQARTTWLNHDEVTRLIDQCQDSLHRCFVTLAVDTGMRKNEILKLHRNEIDLDQAVIALGNVETTRTKTGVGRLVPLSNRARTSLKELLTEHQSRPDWTGYLFENPRTRKPLQNPQKFWKNVKRRAGLGDVRIHDLRHTFVSLALQSGADETSIMPISGHRSKNAFARYAHASVSSIRRVVQLMEDTQKAHASQISQAHKKQGE